MKIKILVTILVLIILLVIVAIFTQKPAVQFLPKSNGKVIHHGDYSLAYSEKHEQAYWVSYELTKNEVLSRTKRNDQFREDPKVKTGSAMISDYKGSGYDRGHLKPAADSKEDAKEMSESFYFSNISPQNKKFNRGIWKDLEELVRDWAIKEGKIHVVVGPILKGKLKTIGKNKVAVPNYFYKIVLDLTSDNKKAIGFIIPNKPVKNYQMIDFVIPIDKIEEGTGIDFFHELPDSLEDRLEFLSNIKEWDFPEIKSKRQEIGVKRLPQKRRKKNKLPYTINKDSGVRHNSTCKYYNCKNCTSEGSKIGVPCSLCGG